MLKVVLDTNVSVSGFISPKGAPAKLIDLWQKDKLTAFLSFLKFVALKEQLG